MELVEQASLREEATAALDGLREEVHLLQSEKRTLRAAMAPLASLQGDVRELSAKVASLKEERAVAKAAQDTLEDTLTLARLSVKV